MLFERKPQVDVFLFALATIHRLLITHVKTIKSVKLKQFLSGLVEVEIDTVAGLLKRIGRSMRAKQDNVHVHGNPGMIRDFVEVTNERFEMRRQCGLSAVIHGNHGGRPGQCRILDMSASGARLGIIRPPTGGSWSNEKFWLHLPHDGSQVRCQLVWKEGQSCGVRFISPIQTVPRRRKTASQPSRSKRSVLSIFSF